MISTIVLLMAASTRWTKKLILFRSEKHRAVAFSSKTPNIRDEHGSVWFVHAENNWQRSYDEHSVVAGTGLASGLWVVFKQNVNLVRGCCDVFAIRGACPKFGQLLLGGGLPQHGVFHSWPKRCRISVSVLPPGSFICCSIS